MVEGEARAISYQNTLSFQNIKHGQPRILVRVKGDASRALQLLRGELSRYGPHALIRVDKGVITVEFQKDVEPTLKEIREGHFVACHFAEELARKPG